MNAKRKLVYDFLSLLYVRRMEIVNKLGLSEEGDDKLPEQSRNAFYFIRAQKKNLLAEFRQEVENYQK